MIDLTCKKKKYASQRYSWGHSSIQLQYAYRKELTCLLWSICFQNSSHMIFFLRFSRNVVFLARPFYLSGSIKTVVTMIQETKKVIWKNYWLWNTKLKLQNKTLYTFNHMSTKTWRFPGCTVSHRRCRIYPWVRKIPWRRKWQPTPVFLPGKSHGQRGMRGYSLWGLKRVRHNLAN